jgi:hypothetical protein
LKDIGQDRKQSDYSKQDRCSRRARVKQKQNQAVNEGKVVSERKPRNRESFAKL